jgi:cytoskeletal protein RodZ
MTTTQTVLYWIKLNWKKILFGVILIIFICLALTSCGARKVNKSKEVIDQVKETELITTDNTKVEIKTDTNTKVIDCTSTDEVEIRPADEKEIMVVNGKTYKNAILKVKKVKSNVVTDNKVIVAETKENDVKTTEKAKVQTSVNKESKQSDRKQFDWTWIILLIVAVIMFLLWWYFGIGKKKTK